MQLIKKITTILIIFILTLIVVSGCNFKNTYKSLEGRKATQQTGEDKSNKPQSNWLTYIDKERGIRFDYPADWLLFSDLDSLPSGAIFHAGDKDFAGEVGGEVPLSFSLRVISQNKYIKEQFFDYVNPEELVQPVSDKVILAGEELIREKYVNGAAEGATDIIYLLEHEKAGNIYVLKFQYTLAGCSVRSQEMQADCYQEMEAFPKDQEKIMDKIILSFRISQ